jgi:hypothetical protein
MRWLWLALLGACAGDGSADTPSDSSPTDSGTDTDTQTTDPSCPTASVSIGTGIFGFEALEEGAPLEMVYGPQGGWHFETAAQVVGFGPQVQFKGIATVVRNGETIAGANDEPVEVDMRTAGIGTWDREACEGTFYGQLTYIDDVEVGSGATLIQRMCALDATDVSFTLEVTDPDTGTVVSDTVTVFARLDPTTPCP